MSTKLFPQVVSDLFLKVIGRQPRPETEETLERAGERTHQVPDAPAESGEDKLKRAAERNDPHKRG